MRMKLIVLAATTALALAAASTGSQAATSSSSSSFACNVFANPWPSMESEDGSPPAISMHNPSCSTLPTAPASTPLKHTGQTVTLKTSGAAVSAHS